MHPVQLFKYALNIEMSIKMGIKLAVFNVCYDWFKVTRPFIPKEE